MTKEVIHLIIRQTADGFYATSPQAPGLIFGRASLEEIRAELQSVLSFHFDGTWSGRVIEHLEQQVELDEREIVFREANDSHYLERGEVRNRIKAALARPEQVRSLAEVPTNLIGEITFVCAVPSDTVGWVCAQFDSRGDAMIVALAVSEALVFTIPLAHGANDYKNWPTIADSGHTESTTLSEVMSRATIVESVARLSLFAS